MKHLNLFILIVLVGLTIQTAHAQTAAEYVKRAQTAQSRGDNAGQVMNASEAIKLEPQNAFAYFIRGGGYFAMSKYEEAIADASKVIAIDPTIAAPYFLRGSALIFLRPADWKIALADFDKEIELDPTYPNAFRMRAMIYTEHTDKADAAFADADKAVKLDASYADAYQERGRAEVDLKKFADADNDYTTAIKLGKNTSKIYNLRSIAKFGESKRDEAIADLRKSLELDPNNQQAKENLDYALTHAVNTEMQPPVPATSTVQTGSQFFFSFTYPFYNDTYEKVMPGVEKLFKKLTTHHYRQGEVVKIGNNTYIDDPIATDKNTLGSRMNTLRQAFKSIAESPYFNELSAEQKQLYRDRLNKAEALQTEAVRLKVMIVIDDK